MKAPLPPDEAARLEALHDYAILDTAPESDFDDITLLASQICETPIAMVSLVDRDRQWFKSKVGASESEMPRDISICAHGILHGGVFVVPDALADARFAASPLVTEGARVRFYAGAPLISPDGHALGMLCVWDHVPRELSAAKLAALQALSRQVVALLELRRSLTKLQVAKQSLLQAHDRMEAQVRQRTAEILREKNLNQGIIDSLPGLFYLIDENARFLRWNEALGVVSGYSTAEISGLSALDLFRGADKSLIAGKMQQVFATGEAVVEAAFVAKDGTSTPYLFNGKRSEYEGRPCLIGLGIDITDRKRAELELAQTHQQLVTASRQAGMAEFATGILHNVGNVLNSVNIASTCVADSLRRSKAASLSKVVALLREHEKDLGDFLTNGPKGRQVPAYLAQLAEHMVSEQAVALRELAELQKNIEHIKEIIVTQQGMAKTSGAAEAVSVTELVEGALRMNSSAVARHNITVVNECADLPPVIVEKSRALQILVNLVRNAKQSCAASDQPEKKLTIRATAGTGHVRIAVTDNGVGIPAGNLAKIFTHGFTTKEDGHGFGLHSAMLAAKEMGGSLTVHSEGAGRGATFVLELPCKPEILAR